MERFEEKRKGSYSFSDGELREAAVKVMYALADALPENPEPEHAFSEGFQAKMRKLIRKSRAAQAFRTLARGAAAVLLMALITASVWLAFDGEARADFLQWVRKEYEARIVYNFFEGREEKELPKIEFGWLPEDCVESSAEVSRDHGYILFDVGNGENILLYYRYMYSATSYSITRDSTVTHEKVFVNDIAADFYGDLEDGGSNMLWWSNEAVGIEFDLNAPLDKETMIKIAENIKIIW